MAYRVALPKNKENFAQKPESLGSLSLPEITGNTGNTGNRAPAMTTNVTEGPIIAVEICSIILEADIWLAFNEDFNPGDGQAVFYADELGFLKTNDAQSLREIHKAKLTFPGARVIQEGPD